jgi:hypothetical protein
MIKNEKNIEINFKNVKPIEFLRLLRLYGMKRKDYCDLRGKKATLVERSFE